MRNITLSGGVAPARADIDELLPDVLDGTVEPAAGSVPACCTACEPRLSVAKAPRSASSASGASA